MAPKDLSCPVCSADILLAGDERAGEEVFCTYCGAPCRLTAPAASDDCEVEEDF
jgi:DNA-directed RNA polymerase subunit RPC12/RpoP